MTIKLPCLYFGISISYFNALETLAVSGDDDANGALIWDCETSCRTQTLGVANATTLSTPVIDVCTFGKGEHLALLTERQVDLFRWSRHNSDS